MRKVAGAAGRLVQIRQLFSTNEGLRVRCRRRIYVWELISTEPALPHESVHVPVLRSTVPWLNMRRKAAFVFTLVREVDRPVAAALTRVEQSFIRYRRPRCEVM